MPAQASMLPIEARGLDRFGHEAGVAMGGVRCWVYSVYGFLLLMASLSVACMVGLSLPIPLIQSLVFDTGKCCGIAYVLRSKRLCVTLGYIS